MGTWTLEVPGGPAFMQNVLNVLGMLRDSNMPQGVRHEVLARLTEACEKATFTETKEATRAAPGTYQPELWYPRVSWGADGREVQARICPIGVKDPRTSGPYQEVLDAGPGFVIQAARMSVCFTWISGAELASHDGEN